jgi:hypothetical protein
MNGTKLRQHALLDHDPIGWNRIMISSLCLSMIFPEIRSRFSGSML